MAGVKPILQKQNCNGHKLQSGGNDMPHSCSPAFPIRHATSVWQPSTMPLGNTHPLHHQNSVGTCCVQCVAQ